MPDAAAVFSPIGNMYAMIFIAHIVLHARCFSCMYFYLPSAFKLFLDVMLYLHCMVGCLFCECAVIMPKYGKEHGFLESLVSWLKPYMGIEVAIHA